MTRITRAMICAKANSTGLDIVAIQKPTPITFARYCIIVRAGRGDDINGRFEKAGFDVKGIAWPDQIGSCATVIADIPMPTI